MTLRPTLGLQQRQRLALTQEIKSSLQYLALAGLRLEQKLQDVVDSNPFLTASNAHSAQEDADWIAKLANPGPESLGAALRHLAADLFWQVEDRALANLLIDEVAATGLLSQPLKNIPRPAGVRLDDLERIQTVFLGEGGLLADDLGQCFAAQVQARIQVGDLNQTLAAHVLNLCADLKGLAQGRVVAEPAALAVLRDLNPEPASDLDLEQTLILPPDLILTPSGRGWAVQLNPLTHRTYEVDQEMLTGLSAAALKQDQVAEPLRAARATVRALQARRQTLTDLLLFLADRQDQALRSGRAALGPLTQGEAAAVLDLHPSTISRAVAGKTVETPQGVWALRDFFTALIDPETRLSGAGLRAWLAQKIADEDRSRPKSDASLATDLQDLGHQVARRTLTKYRLRLGLPGAAQRARTYARLPLSAKSTQILTQKG